MLWKWIKSKNNLNKFDVNCFCQQVVMSFLTKEWYKSWMTCTMSSWSHWQCKHHLPAQSRVPFGAQSRGTLWIHLYTIYRNYQHFLSLLHIISLMSQRKLIFKGHYLKAVWLGLPCLVQYFTCLSCWIILIFVQ